MTFREINLIREKIKKNDSRVILYVEFAETVFTGLCVRRARIFEICKVNTFCSHLVECFVRFFHIFQMFNIFCLIFLYNEILDEK